MKIILTRNHLPYGMEAINETGQHVMMDASPEIGGNNSGMRPMQLLIAGLGGCSSIDIIQILQKQRQELKDIIVEIEAERESDKTPSLFSNIHIRFILYGDVDYDKAKKAIELSMEKYCSVARILEKTAKIEYTFQLNK